MSESFGSEFYKNNRAKLRSLFKGTAPIILSANAVLQRSADQTFEFRQDANFLYLTGLNLAEVILVIDKDKEYLILPERAKYSDHMEAQIDNAEITSISGIEEVLDNREGWRRLGSRLKRVKHIASVPVLPKYYKEFGFYTNPARHELLRKIKRINIGIDVISLAPQLAKLRSVKQPEELAAIRKAISITVEALKSVKKKLSGFGNESGIDALIHSTFLKHQSQPAFRSVVAGGKNAVTIHYNKNNQPINQTDLIVLDVGAEVNRYSADITRTFAITKPSKRQQQIFDAVMDTQEYAVSKLKPGVTIKDYEEEVAHFMGEQLRELGLIKSIDKDAIRKYFPHMTSHFLGLDTHDVGLYDEPLAAGMVLTVEPGIYIPEEGIGVRIEDDYLVTADGVECLSISLPSSLT